MAFFKHCYFNSYLNKIRYGSTLKNNILFCQNIATCSSFSRWMIYSSFLITRTTWWWWFHRIRQITRGQLSFTLRVSWLGLLIFSGFTSSLSKAKINQFEYLLLSVIQKVGWFDITFMGKRVIWKRHQLHSNQAWLEWRLFGMGQKVVSRLAWIKLSPIHATP